MGSGGASLTSGAKCAKFSLVLFNIVFFVSIVAEMTIFPWGDNFSKHKLLFQAHNIFSRRRFFLEHIIFLSA